MASSEEETNDRNNGSSTGASHSMIPPMWNDGDEEEELDYDDDDDDNKVDIGPSIAHKDSDDDDEANRLFGPALPPDLQDNNGHSMTSSTEAQIFGPMIPPDLLPTSSVNGHDDDDDDRAPIIGPAMMPPPSDLMNNLDMPVDDDDDDEQEVNNIIGPMPPTEDELSIVDAAYHHRLQLYEANEKQNSSCKREEWMIKLPKKLTGYGLGARKFQKNPGAVSKPGDQSKWTETPTERARKLATNAVDESEAGPSTEHIERIQNAKRDHLLEKRAIELNKNRTTSLIDMHSRKRKQADVDKTKEVEVSSTERRPFNRDTDLKISGFGGGKLDELKKRASELNSRFSNKESQKYL